MKIEDYLYHRDPYLLIDKVESISQKQITTSKDLREDEFYFKGHFPSAPVLPGALMQEMTTQTAGILIAKEYNPLGEDYDTNNFDPKRPALGVLSRVKDARYKSFARPGDLLHIQVDLIESLDNYFEFKAKILRGDKLIMSNHFILSNILSQELIASS